MALEDESQSASRASKDKEITQALGEGATVVVGPPLRARAAALRMSMSAPARPILHSPLD